MHSAIADEELLAIGLVISVGGCVNLLRLIQAVAFFMCMHVVAHQGSLKAIVGKDAEGIAVLFLCNWAVDSIASQLVCAQACANSPLRR